MRSTVALALSAFVATAIASQIQSNNPAFPADHKGCITGSSNADGASVVIQECLTSGDISSQNWNVVQNGAPQQLRIFGDKCLDVTNGVNADGTPLQLFTCFPGNTNQLFIPFADNTFLWSGTNKCIDLTNGNTANGNRLQIFTCFPGNSNQQWSIVTPPPTGVATRFRATGGSPTPSVCMTAASNANGDRISLDVCGSPTGTFPGGSDTWVFPAPGSSGPISTFGGTKCLDVRDGNPNDGTAVQVFDCVPGNTNQMFTIGGSAAARSVSWVGHTKCLDVRGSNFTPGTANIQIWECDPNNTNQHWVLQ